MPPPRTAFTRSCFLEIFFFDKRNSGGFFFSNPGVWLAFLHFFWECLSRASCKEDVAEERCFLTDKGKASLRQDVWAWLGPALKSQREGRQPAVQSEEEAAPRRLASHLRAVYSLCSGVLCQPGLLCVDHRTVHNTHTPVFHPVCVLVTHLGAADVINLTRMATFIKSCCFCEVRSLPSGSETLRRGRSLEGRCPR